MKKHVLMLVATFLFATGYAQSPSGFSSASGQRQLEWEKKFDGKLDPKNLDEWMKYMTARPHHLGSPYGKQVAEYMKNLFTSWGYDARIETYKVLFPTPQVRKLEMVGPTKFTAKLAEPPLKEDGTSGLTKEQLPVYNAWSADGNVTAELVFVNYGIPADYEELEKMGIDVKGKIVIAKYGGSWRGIKPKVAQEKGAIGCIIYSDPANDGYFQGDVYPKGPYRNQNGAQRGSVQDMPIYPGDPLTPDIGATADAKRIRREDAVNLIKIPVIPISYGDAQPLLQALGGPVAPESWRGALPITYHVGPGSSKVHLELKFNWEMVDCHDVIAVMKGSELPDEWVIRGNHHDAWVNGASDPISGMVALMEEARAVAELAKEGYKPKRTVIYCAWDGEEPSLIGSTEWVEDHAAELQKKAVAYINSDGNGRGFLYAGGSHTLETLVNDVAKGITDPQTGITIFERSKSVRLANTPDTKGKRELLGKKSLPISALGSGSDYSPFFQHLGIPALNIGFGGESGGGEYHSVYDSYDLYKRFKDPKFAYGVALAMTAGHTTLRLANAEVLPFDFAPFQRTVEGYLKEVIKLADDMREATDVENQMLEEKRYTYASDPTEVFIAPKPKSPVPFMNFSELQNAMETLKRSVANYSEVAGKSASLKGDDLTKFNQLLFTAEQKLLADSGLPRRPWYKHTIYAPGFYTGYGVKTLPGVREAIEQRSWEEAQQQIEIVAKTLLAYSEQIDSATALLAK